MFNKFRIGEMRHGTHDCGAYPGKMSKTGNRQEGFEILPGGTYLHDHRAPKDIADFIIKTGVTQRRRQIRSNAKKKTNQE
jgi:hypothetical protein